MRPSVSPQCAAGAHQRCAHWAGLRVRGAWRLRPQQVAVVCADPWHGGHGCPLAGRREVPAEELRSRCTCPGVEAFRRSSEQVAARQDLVRAVVAGTDLDDRPDPVTVERRLVEGYRAAGEQPPPGLAALSGVLAARSRAPGTRTARLSWLGLRTAVRGVRQTWTPGGDRTARGMQAATAAVWALAVLLTAGAVRATGWPRVVLALAALPVWLLGLQSAVITALVTAVVRGRADRRAQ